MSSSWCHETPRETRDRGRKGCLATLPGTNRTDSCQFLEEGTKVSPAKVKHLEIFLPSGGVPFPGQINGLLRSTDASRLLYGSDFPYTLAVRDSEDGESHG